MTQEQQDAGRGIDLARRAMIAMSEGDEAQALAILNEAETTGEAVYATSQMLACLWDATLTLHKQNERKAAAALRLAAQMLNEYAVLAQVELIVRDAERSGDHG